jgi:hypothetical protein
MIAWRLETRQEEGGGKRFGGREVLRPHVVDADGKGTPYGATQMVGAVRKCVPSGRLRERSCALVDQALPFNHHTKTKKI